MHALEHLTIILIAVLLAYFAARKTRLTPVLFYLAAGAILVNTGILPVEADPFIKGFAEVGIILIMFALGFEENTRNFLASVRRSWGIAFFGALAPFCTAYFVTLTLWGDPRVALLCGLAMTATAVSLTMVSLKTEGLAKSRAATGIMTSAVLDDIASLALVAILVPVATGAGTTSPADIALIIGKTILFFVMVVALAAVVFPHEMTGFLARLGFLHRFNIRALLGFGTGEQATLVVLIVALLVGLAAHAFGFHPAIGAYMAGLILKEEYFLVRKDGSPRGFNQTKHVIENVAFTWIGPVFFVDLGTAIIFDSDLLMTVFPAALLLTALLIVAQVTSAALAARYTGRFAWGDSVMIGFGMLGRAELAFVVLDIAYRQNDLLTEQAFYTLMITCFGLNLAVPLTIAWWKPYYLGQKTLFGAWPGRTDDPGITPSRNG